MDRVLARVKDLEDRQDGKSVSMGGYSFKDARAVQAWVTTLGDDEIYRFAVDFKAQLVACGDDSLTIAETIQNRAAATKAGYNTWRAARMAGTFLVVYPDSIFKKSGSKDAATHGGFCFQPSFGSHTVFEGTAEFSACEALKKQLSDNLATYQESIDVEFPPEQSRNARSHAVFSAIVRRGYYQAIGFLNAIMPFYKLLAMAGLPATEACGKKMLTFTMSIFETTHRVRTITSEGAAHTMLFRIMRATKLLDEYAFTDYDRSEERRNQ